MNKWLFAVFLLLAGCSATEPKPTASTASKSPCAKDLEQLYLRGTFSLWGYQEQYQLQKVGRSLYAAAAELTEEREYEFMFSGKDASKANCGYLAEQDQWLTVGKTVFANCQNVVLQNFIFKPVVSGMYEFFIDFSQPQKPKVYVKKAY